MAEGADVIELGSSDEEPEPAPKKPKRLNAMVSIPDNLPNLTIKKKGSPQQLGKVHVSSNVQNLIKNPFANKQVQMAKKIVNGKPQKASPQKALPQKGWSTRAVTQHKAPPLKISVNMPILGKNTLNVQNKNFTVAGIKSPNTARINKSLTLSKNITGVGTFIKPVGTAAAKTIVTPADMATAKSILKNFQSGGSFKMGTPLKVATHIKQPQNMIRTGLPRIVGNPVPRIVGNPVSLLSATSRKPPVRSQESINNLPPGITIKRVSDQGKRHKGKRAPSPAKVTFKKKKLDSGAAADVPTVELDDDDELPPYPASTGPQWYVRPEDANKPKETEPEPPTKPTQQPEPVSQISAEVENNTEPEERGKQMIEITIEDSPIKPPPITPAGKMISDLSIIIEDSPQKGKDDAQNVNKEKGSSDEEYTEVQRTPPSKKKLNFPKETNHFIEVEVEFESPLQSLPVKTVTNNIIPVDTFEVPVETVTPPKPSINMESKTPKDLTPSKVVHPEELQKKTEENGDLDHNKVMDFQQKSNEKECPKEVKKKCETSPNIHKKQKHQEIAPNTVPQDSETASSKIRIDHNKLTDFQQKSNEKECPKEVKKKCETSPNIHKKQKHQEIAPNTEPQDSAIASSKSKEPNPPIPSTSKRKDTVASPPSSKSNDHNKPSTIKTDPVPTSTKSKDRDSLPSTDKNKTKDPLPSFSRAELQEFNETYQHFINACFELENSEDMKKIVEKKVKEYYKQVDKSFTDSEGFVELVSSKVKAMKQTPENLYLYIKDIVDELKMRRKQKGKPEVKQKLVENPKQKEPEEAQNSDEGQDSEGSDRNSRNIRKLEKTLRKLHRAIQKLEEQEVDFDDDTDSVYLLTESEDGKSSQAKESTPEKDRQIQISRYKERLVRVHAKLCQLTSTKMPSEPRVSLEPRAGRPVGPTLKLEQWINKKVPMGAPLPFPDFHDVIRCVREANGEDKLGWSEMEIMDEARDLFSRCGKILQRRRQKNEWRIAASRIAESSDPADLSTELKEKLEQNKKIAAKRENDVINKYADRQNLLKLEGKEIGENEIEESAPSSDDEVQAIEDDDTASSKREKSVSPSKKDDSTPKKCPTQIIPVIVQVVSVTDGESIAKTITESTKQAVLLEEETETMKYDMVTVDIVKENGGCESLKEADPMDIDSVPCSQNEDTASQDVTENKATDVGSDSEHIRLVLSDEDSNHVNSDEKQTDPLQSELEIASSITSSDVDAPIAISDTNEPSDNGGRTTAKSSDVVSIENSSYSDSDTNDNHSSSKEKQSLLEIDNTDDESGVETVTENEHDALSLVEEKEGPSEKESEVTSTKTVLDDIDSILSCSPTAESIELNKSPASILPSDKTKEADDEVNHESVLETSGRKNHTYFDDIELSNTDIEITLDAEKKVVTRPISIDDSRSGENQNTDTLSKAEPTIIQGADILSSPFRVSPHSKDSSFLPDSEVLEKVSGETFEKEIKETILSPSKNEDIETLVIGDCRDSPHNPDTAKIEEAADDISEEIESYAPQDAEHKTDESKSNSPEIITKGPLPESESESISESTEDKAAMDKRHTISKDEDEEADDDISEETKSHAPQDAEHKTDESKSISPEINTKGPLPESESISESTEDKAAIDKRHTISKDEDEEAADDISEEIKSYAPQDAEHTTDESKSISLEIITKGPLPESESISESTEDKAALDERHTISKDEDALVEGGLSSLTENDDKTSKISDLISSTDNQMDIDVPEIEIPIISEMANSAPTVDLNVALAGD